MVSSQPLYRFAILFVMGFIMQVGAGAAAPNTPAPTFSPGTVTVFVDGKASNTDNCGTEVQPCSTLKAGLKKLESEFSANKQYVLNVKAGNYKGDDNKRINIIREDIKYYIIGSDDESNPTIIDAENEGYIFNIATGNDVTLKHLHFTGASKSAIKAAGEGTRVRMENCRFEKNSASTVGGALSVTSKASLDLFDTEMSENSAPLGGAIWAEPGSEIAIKGSKFSGNRAISGDGGALYILQATNMKIDTETLFEDNTAAGNGGSIFAFCTDDNVETGQQYMLDNVKFESGSAEASGGHIFLQGCRIAISKSTFTGGVAQNGGSIVSDAVVNLNEVTVQNCKSNRNGGALYFLAGANLIAGKTTISDNKALSGNGGGMYVQNAEDFTVNMEDDCLFANNAAPQGGGGAYYFESSQSSSWNILADFTNNSAAYGPKEAGGEKQLCLAITKSSDELICEALTSKASTDTLKSILKKAESKLCSGKQGTMSIDVRTDSGLPDNVILYQNDSFGNEFMSDGSRIIANVNGGEISGSNEITLGTGTQASCLSNLNIQAKPETSATLVFEDTSSRENQKLSVNVKMLTCDPNKGEVLREGIFCDSCPGGTYATEFPLGQEQCEACPSAGALCKDGVLVLDDGWWYPHAELQGRRIDALEMVRCPVEEFCHSSIVDLDNIAKGVQDPFCIENHTGAYCLGCTADNTKMNPASSCTTCPSNAALGFIVFVVVLWGIVLGLSIVNLAIKDQGTPSILKADYVRANYFRYNLILGVVKILLSHFQIIGLVLIVQVRWEQYLGRYFVASQALSVSGLDWAKCLLEAAASGMDLHSSVYLGGIIVAAIPWILILFLVLLSAGAYAMDRSSMNSISGNEFLNRVYISIVTLFLVLNVLFFRAGLEFFACTASYFSDFIWETTPHGESVYNVLIADPFEHCTGSTYNGYAYGLGLGLLIGLYGIGTILFMTIMMLRITCTRKSDALVERLNRWRPTLGVLYRCYRPKYFYWGLIEQMTVVILVIVLVLLQLQGAKQLFAGLIVIGFAIYAQTKMSPFITKEVNSLKVWSLVTIFLTLAIGAFLLPYDAFTEFGYGNSINHGALNALLMTVHMIYILYALLVVLDIYSMDADGRTAYYIRGCLQQLRWRSSGSELEKRAEANMSSSNAQKVEMIDENPDSNSTHANDYREGSDKGISGDHLPVENTQPNLDSAKRRSGNGMGGDSGTAEAKPLKSALKTNGRYSYYDAVTANSDRVTLNSERVTLNSEKVVLDERPFEVDERIRITNLSKMQEFNGKEGAFREFFPEKRRYEVMLDDGSILRLRRKHIVRLNMPSSEPMPEPSSEPEPSASFTSNTSKGSTSTRSGPTDKERKLQAEVERLQEVIAALKKENKSLKKEVKYLDGLNQGMIEGYGKP